MYLYIQQVLYTNRNKGYFYIQSHVIHSAYFFSRIFLNIFDLVSNYCRHADRSLIIFYAVIIDVSTTWCSSQHYIVQLLAMQVQLIALHTVALSNANHSLQQCKVQFLALHLLSAIVVSTTWCSRWHYMAKSFNFGIVVSTTQHSRQQCKCSCQSIIPQLLAMQNVVVGNASVALGTTQQTH